MTDGAAQMCIRDSDEVVNRREWMDHLIFERNVARDESSQRAERIEELSALLNQAMLERDVAITRCV